MPDWLYTLLHQVCFSFCIRDARLATKPFTLYDRGCSCSDETYVTSYACISWILLGYMLNHTESEYHISFGVNMYILYSLLLYFYLDYLHCIYVWCKHSLMLLLVAQSWGNYPPPSKCWRHADYIKLVLLLTQM